jgi:hypothetical protein
MFLPIHMGRWPKAGGVKGDYSAAFDPSAPTGHLPI